MKINKKGLTVVCIMLLLLFIIPYVAKAWVTYTIALMSWDLVDSGKHLDYTDNSKYTSYINQAINTWESYKSGIIRKDTLTTVNDVTFSDVESLGVDAAGLTINAQTSKSGTIKFSTNVMDSFSSEKKLNVVTHEIGHALRLDHRNESDSVMYSYATTNTSLSTGDKRNYDAAYEEY